VGFVPVMPVPVVVVQLRPGVQPAGLFALPIEMLAVTGCEI